MAESSGNVDVVCSERAWRAGVVAAVVTFPLCVLAAVAVAVRYGPLSLVVSTLLVPNVLLLVSVGVERAVTGLERPAEQPALRPRIAGER